MQIINEHKFHLVNRSQLPFLASGFAMLLTMSFVFFLHPSNVPLTLRWDNFLLHISVICIFAVILSWFLMVIFESARGYHTRVVQVGLRYGFWLFLISEAMLFFSFFWAYFHFSLNPSISIGHQWPPELGIQQIDPYKIPLLNTILLLSSGFTATLAHRATLTTDFIWNSFRKNQFYTSLIATIILGYIFLACQAIEYVYGLQQTWMSNVYWSIFFLLTGFHGVHVIIGTLFLQFNLVRIFLFNLNIIKFSNFLSKFYGIYFLIHMFIYKKLSKSDLKTLNSTKRKILIGCVKQKTNLIHQLLGNGSEFKKAILPQMSRFVFNAEQHLGFEAALYYWHFVDAVWILLYMIVYVWGS